MKKDLKAYDKDVSLAIKWLKELRSVFKQHVNVSISILLITLGGSFIKGPLSSFWQMLVIMLYNLFGVDYTPNNDSDSVAIVRMIIGLLIIVSGIFVLFKRRSDQVQPNEPHEKALISKTPDIFTEGNRPLFIEINRENERYSGSIFQEKWEAAFPLADLQIEKSTTLVTGNSRTLGEVVEALHNFTSSNLSEGIQLKIGEFLFQQTLGQLPEGEREKLMKESGLFVKIVTKNEWIAALPWNLMAHMGKLLCARGWSFALTKEPARSECILPPSPSFLIIAPQPVGEAETGAREHLEELENHLFVYNPALSFGHNLKEVHTWEEFIVEIETFQPHIIYYYGHASGDSDRMSLLFSTETDQKRLEKSISDFIQALERLKRPPVLIYINCCSGNSGGHFVGAGLSLHNIIPAVIISRTLTNITTAREQALILLKSILIWAISPHKAVAALHTSMDLTKSSIVDMHWRTPLFFGDYKKWMAQRATAPDRLTEDPYWNLKIDRVKQYSLVSSQTGLMMREQKPRSHVFVWYGQEGQGIETFHKRLLVELREQLTSTCVLQIRPRWPEHLEQEDDYHTAFGDVLAETFNKVRSIEEIPSHIRSESQGKPTLLYVRHEPVRSTRVINPVSLKQYVKWWDTEFVPKLEKKQYALLTISFLVNNPPQFVEDMKEEKIEELHNQHTVFWLLDEMENVAKRDLLLFLQTHNITLPEDRRDEVLDAVIKSTGGQYEQTIEELKNLRKMAWRVRGTKKSKGKKMEKKEFDY